MIFDWNDKKNKELKAKRDISLEEIVISIKEGKVIDVLDHPKPEKYPNQQIYLVWCRNYVYVVPFVKKEEKQEIFLKTISPSRMYTKKYRSGMDNE